MSLKNNCNELCLHHHPMLSKNFTSLDLAITFIIRVACSNFILLEVLLLLPKEMQETPVTAVWV